jgi:hypothetical protein
MIMKKLKQQTDNATSATCSEMLLSNFEFEEKDELCNAICSLISPKSGSDGSDPWKEIKLSKCTGRVDLVVTAILASSCKRFVWMDHSLTCSVAMALGAGLESNTKLQRLFLRGIREELSRDAMVCISRGLARSTTTTLAELSIRGSFTIMEMNRGMTILNREAVWELAQGLRSNQSLRVIDLEGCNLADALVAELIIAACPFSLETLNLRGNQARFVALKAIRQLLSDPSCKLAKLNLSWQRRTSPEQNLDLSLLNLTTNTSLQSLILSENRLHDNDMTNLALGLRNNSTLGDLEMYDCQISDSGIAAFAEILPQAMGLRKLKLDGKQEFELLGLKRLIRGLRHNFSVERCVLPDGYISKELQSYLDLNRAGRRLLKSDLSASLWSFVLERADRIARQEVNSSKQATTRSANVLFCLLRERVLLERAAIAVRTFSTRSGIELVWEGGNLTTSKPLTTFPNSPHHVEV